MFLYTLSEGVAGLFVFNYQGFEIINLLNRSTAVPEKNVLGFAENNDGRHISSFAIFGCAAACANS